MNFTITQGTSPQFRILVNGTQVHYTYNESKYLIQTNYLNGHSFSMDYTVEIYAWNHISSSYVVDTFSILIPITNPQIRSSTVDTIFPGPILFEYTMESGTNVNISFLFSDTSANNTATCQYIGDYPTNVWNHCQGTNHTFEIPGAITVIVAFTNSISTIHRYLTVKLTTSVNPIEVRTDIQLSSSRCVAAFTDNRAVASFFIQSSNITAKPAANAQYIIIPDSISQPTVTQGPFPLILDYFSSPATTSNGMNVIYPSTGKKSNN